MGNNFTNINNRLLCLLTELMQRPRHMTLEIHVLSWDIHKDMTGINWLIGSQTFYPGKWVSIDKRLRSCTDSLQIIKLSQGLTTKTWTT